MLKKIIKQALSYNEFRHVNRILSKKKKNPVDLNVSKRFLCIQMNAIGDAVMTQPAWSAIGSAYPQATIDLVCSPHIAPLFENDPSVGRIHRWTKCRYRPWLFENAEGVRQAVIEKNYDVIFDFTALPLTASLCALNGMPPSIGFHRSMKTSAGLLDLGCAYDRTYPYSEQDHIKALMFSLVDALLKIEKQEVKSKIYLDENSHQQATALLADFGLKEKTFFIVHPGTKWLPKAWPIPYWQRLIRFIRADMNLPVIILGGVAEKSIIEAILLDNGLGNVPHYISTDIKLSAALIQSSMICLCHDSAPMHMASALGVQTVALFGPVLPSRSAPQESEGCRALHRDMFCSPCQLYYSKDRCRRGINFCMYAISPDEVVLAVREALHALNPVS